MNSPDERRERLDELTPIVEAHDLLCRCSTCSEFMRLADAERKERCGTCKGTGTLAEYTGLRLRQVEVDCHACNGTGYRDA